MLHSSHPHSKHGEPPNHGERRGGQVTRQRVVIVGNGMVSWKLCAKLVERGGHTTNEITVFGEEPVAAYDRVHLTEYFANTNGDALSLAPSDWYAEHGIDLRTGERIVAIDRESKRVRTERGDLVPYDKLVLATGSAPWVPPIPGVQKRGVFVYRTLADLDALRAYARHARRCAVLGGGLLGLEAARAVQALGLDSHVVEMSPRLMPRQLDEIGGKLLLRSIEALGVQVHLGHRTQQIVGNGCVEGLVFEDGDELAVDMVVVSAGIRPRDELARDACLDVGERGGIVVNDDLTTSALDIYAIGECAAHRGVQYGLVAPGYEMADALARTLTGDPSTFDGADQSTKLKLLGVDVASFGDPFADGPETRTVAYQDFVRGIYKKVVVSACGTKLIGGVLVGDVQDFATLLHYARSQSPLKGTPDALVLNNVWEGGPALGMGGMPDEALVCSCNGVTKGSICEVVRAGTHEVSDVQAKTCAGTGCGGCLGTVQELVSAELSAMGRQVKRTLCEHFEYTRQELFDIIRVKQLRTFDAVLEQCGRGHGCEVCKPTVASILASIYNDMILKGHDTLQDTNDRYLANVQKGGLYSVVPRIPGGEITPERLIRLGEVAKQYNLYTKITGGQRIDLFGARVEDLPDIWEALIEAGFESGHAYGKAVRTVKSCVGSTWCRYGVQDSVGLAIRIEHRYRGLRAPHKLKSAVSGCTRECAEAQSKDFGVIATEKGWNLYVCGNGGTQPRHADLLASDVDEETLIRFIDRFLMYYIRTADRLTRTSKWVDKLDGGIEHVRDVVVRDSLGLGAELEADMQRLVDSYACEWKAVVEDPDLRARFRHFVNTEEGDPTVKWVEERGQRRPSDWPKEAPATRKQTIRLPVVSTRWVRVGQVADFPGEGGISMKYGDVQLAIFHFSSRNEWYATQNMCPHRQEMVLARGIIGDRGGEPKIACPLHKKTFSLRTGEALSGEDYRLHVFPVKVERGEVFVELPLAETLQTQLCRARSECVADAAE